MSDDEITDAEEPEEVEEKPPAKKPGKKAAKKPAKKAAKKAAKKPAKKAAKKAEEKKPVKKSKAKDGLKKMEDGLAKIGLNDMYDYLTFAAGVWGMIWTVVFFIIFLQTDGSRLSLPIFSTLWNDAAADFGIFLLQIWIYFNLIAFPIMVDKVGMKVIEKWQNFPLHFIKTREDLYAFIVFIGLWSCVFFWIAGWQIRWPHAISCALLILPIFSGPLGGKSIRGKTIPSKKIKE